MTTKYVSMQVYIRDVNGDVVGSDNANGTTEDDGATVVIPLGYLPSLLTAPMTDILRTVIPPPSELPAPASVARTDDFEGNSSTLTFG